MSYVLISLLALGLIGFPLMTLIVTYREKKYVWFLEKQTETPEESVVVQDSDNPYAPHGTIDAALPLSPYALKWGRELFQMEYRLLGDYRHAKGGIYKIRYDIWISHDSQILAWVEAGSVSAIPVLNITMTSIGCAPRDSVSADSHLMIDSFTNESCYDPDLAGSCHSMVFPAASAEELDRLHRQRLTLTETRPFSDDPLENYRQIRQRDAERVCESGLGRFIDAEETIWLPTLLGGLKMFVRLHTFMLGRRMYPHRWRLKRRLRTAV